ncbi:MAG: nicotinate (nicotinamide) nucleotide adenylyltransferase [Bacteroidetes bacterium]|uniref:nicotinate (nicotinamide) nucleotide adenylyltransferase n=1 Tax=[Flexibacter] sp. ATCC 35208 TaxID=1936242 RepID=UPI0009D0078C|nr:nicotinate (nicotinamide) nucleotide adenylyltransferase [[Flexibacter] sp. ATCC 35208]MBP1651260.1 nicotinate (nicotinamide) nucleotide adenylyltransferase [Bacteroidota bacterium]OMP77441.1 nicotinic acid mononucleotide adenylyltransferase [[Flexibacter] sp. ATCC 35208]
MKIGLYFGSFNPIHTGHMIIANFVAYHTDLDKVWLVVSPQNPLKPSASLLNEHNRFHLVELAIQDEPKLRASNIEFSLPRPSFTVDTLAYLTEKFPTQEFVIIMGSDSFQNISRWRNYQHIVRNYPIYVYKRPGHEVTETHGATVKILEAPMLDISATDIRNWIKEGKSIRYMVPDNVVAYITTNNYYK